MDPSQADSREHQRQAIDAKIKSFQESIQELKYRRNTLAPISFLPIEVIESIFSYLRVPTSTLSTFTPGERPEKRDPLSWLRVAHVCHQWREIALNQALFWSHVDFANVSWASAAEILSRAKNAPLYLEARVPQSRWNNIEFSRFQKELQRRTSHIRHLGISTIYPHLYKTLEGLVSPAPILENLTLATEEYCPRPYSLPDSLFNGVTPKLTQLRLHNCDISWKSQILRGLTHLEIRSPTRSARPELAVWLDSLEEMLQLKTLIVHSASPIAPLDASPSFHVKRTTKLPSLTRLDISASLRDCALALAHLDLPALAHLSVATRSHAWAGDDLEVLLPYVTLHSHGSQDTQPLQNMFIYASSMRVDMLAWTVPDIDFDVRDSSVILDTMLSARVSLSITNKHWFSIFNINTKIFEVVLAALPLDSLVSLTAPDHTHFGKQFWRCHAQRWCLLRYVRLGVLAALEFREIVLDSNEEHERSLFPSLIKLALVDSLSTLTGQLIPNLCDILKKRVEQGVPLKVVDMRACDVPDHTALEQLRELGAAVLCPTDERSEPRKPSFAACYSRVRDPLVQDNSDLLDSNVDEDSDDGSEEGGDSDMHDFDDGFDDMLDHTFLTEEYYEGVDDVDFYYDTI